MSHDEATLRNIAIRLPDEVSQGRVEQSVFWGRTHGGRFKGSTTTSFCPHWPKHVERSTRETCSNPIVIKARPGACVFRIVPHGRRSRASARLDEALTEQRQSTSRLSRNPG